jgi:hypothetical protein
MFINYIIRTSFLLGLIVTFVWQKFKDAFCKASWTFSISSLDIRYTRQYTKMAILYLPFLKILIGGHDLAPQTSAKWIRGSNFSTMNFVRGSEWLHVFVNEPGCFLLATIQY